MVAFLNYAGLNPGQVWGRLQGREQYRHALVFGGGGNPIDLAWGSPVSVGTIGGATVPGLSAVGRLGDCVNWGADGTNRGWDVKVAAQPPTTFTLEALVEIGSSLPASLSPICVFGTGVSSFDRSLEIRSTGAVEFYWYDATFGQRAITSTSTFAAGAVLHIAGTSAYNGTNWTFNLYVNGVLEGTLASGAAYTSFALPVAFSVGAIPASPVGGTTWTPNHKQYYVNVLNRALSGAEIAARARDPWAFLAPPTYLDDAALLATADYSVTNAPRLLFYPGRGPRRPGTFVPRDLSNTDFPDRTAAPLYQGLEAATIWPGRGPRRIGRFSEFPYDTSYTGATITALAAMLRGRGALQGTVAGAAALASAMDSMGRLRGPVAGAAALAAAMDSMAHATEGASYPAPSTSTMRGKGSAQPGAGYNAALASTMRGKGTAPDPLAATAALAASLHGAGKASDPLTAMTAVAILATLRGASSAKGALSVVAAAQAIMRAQGRAGPALAGTAALAGTMRGASHALPDTRSLTPLFATMRALGASRAAVAGVAALAGTMRGEAGTRAALGAIAALSGRMKGQAAAREGAQSAMLLAILLHAKLGGRADPTARAAIASTLRGAARGLPAFNPGLAIRMMGRMRARPGASSAVVFHQLRRLQAELREIAFRREVRTIVVRERDMDLYYDLKDPADLEVFGADWTRLLLADEVITTASASVTAPPHLSSAGENPPTLTSAQALVSGTKTGSLCGGGTDGIFYLLDFTIQTNKGRTLKRGIWIPCALR